MFVLFCEQAANLESRRRPSFPKPVRPSLSRTKGLTTSSLPKSTLDVPPQPFKFGNVPGMQAPGTLSLDEVFTDSPEEISFPPNPLAPAAGPRPKSAYLKSNLSAQCSNNGSPGVRKSSAGAPYQRPRKAFRRSLSMFEHPADVLNESKPDPLPACPLQSIADAEETQALGLPHFFPDQDTTPRITKETMIDVLDGKYSHAYARIMVVDCRFEYEYTGGHIAGAINFNDKEELTAQLLDPSACTDLTTPSSRTLLIFHCEYSVHRAPLAARHVRAADRTANAHRYPFLTYPDAYILDGGYSAFFREYKQRCYPQNYVEMADKTHAGACERGLGRLRRGKLTRAQTFAFGQRDSGVEESPTAMGGARGKTADAIMAMDVSPCAAMQPPNRRMCSF